MRAGSRGGANSFGDRHCAGILHSMANLRSTAAVCLVLVPVASLAQTSSLVLIDPAPGFTITKAAGISADGTAVAGYCQGTSGAYTLYSSFRWTAANGR